MTIYANDAFALASQTFTEGNQCARVEGDTLVTASGEKIDVAVADPFPVLKSACPMLDAMYGVSIKDHQKLTIEEKTYLYMLCNRFVRDFKIPEGFIPGGPVFWAGYGFNTYLYTRDTAYSSWLGTAYLLPGVVKSHLQYLRGLRRKVGLKVSRRHEIPIPGVPFEQLDITEPELAATYNTNSYTRRTDDIVWVMGLWEVYKSTRDEALLAYMLEEFAYFDEHVYRYFFDETDGLYRGQPTFIDVGGPCYPGRGPGQTIVLKALSTNCLYVGALGMLHEAAALLGEKAKAAAFEERRGVLIEAIKESFGSCGYPFYKFEDGTYSDRQEVLGLAFLALYDVLPREVSAQLLANYPDGDFGRPLVWPFYDSGRVYHDHSTWPFADTIYALAEYKVGDKVDAVRKTMGKLCRHALNGNFNEVLEWKNGNFVGCSSYIWSAASYLALVYKMIAGMAVSADGKVTFSPVLPVELGDRFELTGLKIGDMTINLKITGNGQKVSQCWINGKRVSSPVVETGDGVRQVDIRLTP